MAKKKSSKKKKVEINTLHLLNNKELEYYSKICSLWCGCIPLDVMWAINTNPYKKIETDLNTSNIIDVNKLIEYQIDMTNKTFSKNEL